MNASMLFVPANRPERYLKAQAGEAGALILDLEDSVPPAGKDERAFRPIVVGFSNGDPYPEHGEAIRKLGEHFRMTLDPVRCYPYRRK